MWHTHGRWYVSPGFCGMRKSLQICGLYKELLDAFHTIELLQRSCKVSVIIIIILLIFQIKELGFREVNGLAQRHTAACGAGGVGGQRGPELTSPGLPSLALPSTGCFMRSELLPLCGSWSGFVHSKVPTLTRSPKGRFCWPGLLIADLEGSAQGWKG